MALGKYKPPPCSIRAAAGLRDYCNKQQEGKQRIRWKFSGTFKEKQIHGRKISNSQYLCLPAYLMLQSSQSKSHLHFWQFGQTNFDFIHYIMQEGKKTSKITFQ